MANKGGRPRKITPHIARKIFLLAGYGLTEEQISEVVGIERTTIYRAKEDVGFSNTIAKCKQEADLLVINSLYRRAIGQYPLDKAFCNDGQVVKTQLFNHEPDTRACEIWLTNRLREEWRKEIQHEETRQKPMMIRILERLHGKEIAKINAGNNQVDVLLGEDFVAEVKAEENGSNHRLNGKV